MPKKEVMKDKGFKVAVVGCGKIGMTTVFAMLIGGVATEMVLWGREKKRLEGEKMDLDEAQPLLPKCRITVTDDMKDLGGANLVVFTAGKAQAPGETRTDLVRENRKIVRELVPGILEAAPQAVVLMVSNPVDVLVQEANMLKEAKRGRIFGTGTMLDTMRFRYYLAEAAGVSPGNVHAYVLGEHGDHSFPVYENAVVGAQSLLSFPGVSREMVAEAYEKAKDAAYKIIAAKGATYYAIGMVIARVARAVKMDEKVVLPVSVPLEGYRGYNRVALSVPCLVGRGGVEEVLEVELSLEEEKGLMEAVTAIKRYIQ